MISHENGAQTSNTLWCDFKKNTKANAPDFLENIENLLVLQK